MGNLIKLSNFSRLVAYQEMFRDGLIITVMLSVGTVILGTILGVILALMRLSDFRPFRFLSLDKDGHLRGEGMLTTGQMKYYGKAVEDMRFQVDETGYYTIYVRAQDRTEFVTYVYVEG